MSITENSAVPSHAPELRWLKPDAYHIRTECERYTVCRMHVGDADHYVAFRLNAGAAATELESRVVPLRSSESERLAAINGLRQRCAADLEVPK